VTVTDGSGTPPPGIDEHLLTPAEVAVLFRVDPKTAARWGAAGKMGACRTPGGHLRFRESAVLDQLRGTARHIELTGVSS